MGAATGRFVLEVVPWFYSQEMLASGPGFSKLARLGGHVKKAASGTHTQWEGAMGRRSTDAGRAVQGLGARTYLVGYMFSTPLLASEGLVEVRVRLIAGAAIRDDPLRGSLWT